MSSDTENKQDEEASPWSIHAPDPPPEEDLWFLPAPPEDVAPTDMPWQIADREVSVDPGQWQAGEAAQYRGLVSAVQAVARFGERLAQAPDGLGARFALGSVSAVLRTEGGWISPEQIALYRALRVATDDAARDLARASWAVHRLTGRAAGPPDPQEGLHAFLGRNIVPDPQDLPGVERPTGPELAALSDRWTAGVAALQGCHPLTRAGFAFALWRGLGVTPFDELLEPSVMAMLVGSHGLAPFLPLSAGWRFDRPAASARGGAGARLAVFYGAVQSGALKALTELQRLSDWQMRARQRTADLSGRTPPLMIDVFLRLPVLSAELMAQTIGCSRPSARRNLAQFEARGLIREVTGQSRYRFWTVRS